MSNYAIARLDDTDEVSDGRCPWRPVRHRLGIRAFGVSAWTGKQAGDRIINEHDEADDEQEELYLVTEGRATFEIDGEREEAAAGAFVFVRPGVKRTAFAEEPGTTIVAIGSSPGKAYEPHGYDVWAPLKALYDAGDYGALPTRAARRSRPSLSTPTRCTTSPAARASPAERRTPSRISAARSSCRSGSVRTRRATRTSRRSATSPHSRTSSARRELSALPESCCAAARAGRQRIVQL
jgi:quercetin dioxygenase-like cupin family protein